MTWTWKIKANNDMKIMDGKLVAVNGSEEVMQRVRVSLQHYLNEYFLNVEGGIPWYESIFGAKANSSKVSNILRKAVLIVPGVVQIIDFNVNYIGSTRSYNINAKIIVKNGPGEDDNDFVVVDGINIPIQD